jgi:hypothetical protein
MNRQFLRMIAATSYFSMALYGIVLYMHDPIVATAIGATLGACGVYSLIGGFNAGHN